ncbi:MAG: bifunctional riboflavin kinase/FAD synthetase [Pseudomonadota bacterium]
MPSDHAPQPHQKTLPLIAAIGNFDGVHVGHLSLLKETIALAEQHNARAGAVVFDPHPRRFFRPDDPPFLISSRSERERLLREAGAQEVLPLTFDAVLSSMTPDEFVAGILKSRLGLHGVTTGSDFRFGKARAGDVAMLGTLCAEHGLVFKAIDPVSDEGSDADGKVGSSAVRLAIAEGDVERAAQLLGRYWTVRGVVQEGQRLGRTIDFPTANVSLGEVIHPANGVYAVSVNTPSAPRVPGVANFGRRPTVDGDTPLLEAHLFDFDQDLYGDEIDVSFLAFIRPEQKFPDITALRKQIALDAEEARRIHTTLAGQ